MEQPLVLCVAASGSSFWSWELQSTLGPAVGPRDRRSLVLMFRRLDDAFDNPAYRMLVAAWLIRSFVGRGRLGGIAAADVWAFGMVYLLAGIRHMDVYCVHGRVVCMDAHSEFKARSAPGRRIERDTAASFVLGRETTSRTHRLQLGHAATAHVCPAEQRRRPEDAHVKSVVVALLSSMATRSTLPVSTARLRPALAHRYLGVVTSRRLRSSSTTSPRRPQDRPQDRSRTDPKTSPHSRPAMLAMAQWLDCEFRDQDGRRGGVLPRRGCTSWAAEKPLAPPSVCVSH